jgi:AmmeMemoRadiSam system protein A
MGDRMEFQVDRDDQEILLRLARLSIREQILEDEALRDELDTLAVTPQLRAKAGVFVTLKSPADTKSLPDGRLRGCIGIMVSDKPLYESVIETAPKAALQDPRFPPLTAEELPEVRISLSILSPMQRLERLDDMVIGRHGLQLVSGSHRSVFLPQVPVEQKWDRQRYLEQLALKAGMRRNGWRGADLFAFETVQFGEKAP